MEKEVRISGRQFVILVFLFTLGTSILIVPATIATVAKQDAWISPLLAVGFGCLFVWLYHSLGGLFPGQTIVQYSEIVLGKWIGIAVSIYLFIATCILFAIGLRDFGDFITTQLMPETPIEAILILFLTIIVFGARLGIETIGRISEILFPFFIALLVIFILLSLPNMKIEHFQTLLGTPVKAIVHGMVHELHFPLLELSLLLMVFPFVNSVASAKKGYVKGLILGGLVLFTITAMSIAILGANSTADHMYPSYVIARRINIAGFLHRVEVIMAALWFISIFIKSVLLFYGSAVSLAQILKLKDYRPLTYPMGLILFVLSIVISPNAVQNIPFFQVTLLPYELSFGLLIPLVLLLAARIHKRRGT